MPGGGGGGTGAGRESFRPPWVRESTTSEASTRTPAWPLRKRQSVSNETGQPTTNAVEEQLASVKASLKKQTTIKPKSENGTVDEDIEIAPVKPSSIKEKKADGENASKPKKAPTETATKKTGTDAPSKKVTTETPAKKVTTEEPPKKANVEEPPKEKLPSKKPPLAKQPSKDDVSAKKPPVLQRQTSKEDAQVKKWRDPLLEKVKESIDKTIANEIPKGHTLTKNESLRSLLKPVPPPMPPPMPPKLPPPPEFKKGAPSREKLKKIESLKSRPRRRPDWSDMMKEVESGRKLKHVECNDRSNPIITKANMVKAKGQYVYESEKGNMHNQLLKAINQGVKLKTVKTNDRSRPNLEGLRKFRRQMTIEEQIQKSQSQANLAEVQEAPPEEEEVDEMDDIDKVRDDLQSTKQLLALELRNKEAQQRENKRLLSRIANLEAELKSERAHVKQEQAKTVISVVDAYDETLVTSLKREVGDTKQVADDLQKRYHKTAEELDEVQSELEEAKRKNAELEKKLEQALKGIYEDEEEPTSYFLQRARDFEKQCATQGILPNSNQNSRRPSHAQKQQSIQKSSSEEEIEESSGEEGEDEEEKMKRKLQKEMKMLGNKIRNLNEKKDKARNERAALKVQLRNQQYALKEERRKYKALKKEVDKMAKLMKETDEDEEEEGSDEESEEPKQGEEEASEEEETESESEEETESETESESEPKDASMEDKKEFMASKVKKLESSFSALKKGNYLIIANVDRLKDDVSKQREMSANLQEDLDSVLAELE